MPVDPLYPQRVTVNGGPHAPAAVIGHPFRVLSPQTFDFSPKHRQVRKKKFPFLMIPSQLDGAAKMEFIGLEDIFTTESTKVTLEFASFSDR